MKNISAKFKIDPSYISELLKVVSESAMNERDQQLCRWLISAFYRITLGDYQSATRQIGYVIKALSDTEEVK